MCARLFRAACAGSTALFVLWLLVYLLPLCYVGVVATAVSPALKLSFSGMVCNVLAMLSEALLFAVVTMSLQRLSGRHIAARVFKWLVVAVFMVFFFTHTLYLRFFHTYFSVSLVGEVRNLLGLGGSVVEVVRASDILVALAFVSLSVWLLAAGRRISVWRQGYVRRLWLVAVPVFAMPVAVVPVAYAVNNGECSGEGVSFVSAICRNETRLYRFERDNYAFRRGLLSLAVRDAFSDAVSRRVLTRADMNLIKAGTKRNQVIVGCASKPHVVFIVAESLNGMSVTATCRGRKVMPFLSDLIAAGGADFHTFDMKSAIRYGQSSDAQIMYFTGLLPHSVFVTVAEYLDNRFHALGSIMKRNGYATAMVVPTAPTFWHQDEACRVFGIDSLFSTVAPGGNWLSDDDEVFEKAGTVLKANRNRKMFLTVLTASTHSPYNVKFDKALQSFSGGTLPEEISNYYSKCNYLDNELRKFIGFLRTEKLYSNTLIVMASDHHAPGIAADADSRLPFVILNAGRLPCAGPAAEVGQQDVYPTLLDLLGLRVDANPSWRGLGYSMFSKEPAAGRMSEDEQQRLSDVILETDGLK